MLAQLPCMAIQPCTAQLPTFSAKVSTLKCAILRRLSPFFLVLKTSIFFNRDCIGPDEIGLDYSWKSRRNSEFLPFLHLAENPNCKELSNQFEMKGCQNVEVCPVWLFFILRLFEVAVTNRPNQIDPQLQSDPFNLCFWLLMWNSGLKVCKETF